MRNCLRIGIDSEQLVPFFARGTQKINQVPAGAAAGIEDAEAGGDAAAQDLVEQVYVNLAELFGKARRGRHEAMIREAHH